MIKKIRVLLAVAGFLCIQSTQATDVAFAGFAYSGESASAATRFAYSKRFESALGIAGINSLLQKKLATTQPQNFTLIPRLDELKGRDQAIAVALVMTNETVSTEQLGNVYKLLVQLRGQALFFDFKSMTVLRAYPFSFAYIDKLTAPPSEASKETDIGYVYQGKDGKPGILDRFTQALAMATLPTNVSRYLQVSTVTIDDEAGAAFPPEYAGEGAKNWVADVFGESIASRVGVPILPYAKGYAIGQVMSMTVADGTVYNLKLPAPDYGFSVHLTRLRKVSFEEQAAGKSLIFGTYATIKLEEPLSGHSYLDGQFKNGEIKVVPVTQLSTDDFPAFQDSMLGLFNKLSSVIAGDNNPWLKSAATGTDIDKQIIATRELLKLCR